MSKSSRDRVSVDLQGLKPALLATAQARAVSPSELIRRVLAEVLDSSAPVPVKRPKGLNVARERIGMRLEAARASELRAAARAAGLSVGDLVTSRMAGVPAAIASARPIDQAAALTASCSALTSLNRDLRHLALLLSQGSVEAARQYRGRLDQVGDEVRAHLQLAAAVLGALKHLGRASNMSGVDTRSAHVD